MAADDDSRLRLAETGIHPPRAGSYLLRYAKEFSWREDNRRISNGDRLSRSAVSKRAKRMADVRRNISRAV